VTITLASIDALLAILRKKTPGHRQAVGASLAKSGEVTVVRSVDEGAVLAVPVPDWPTPATVELYPDGEEWACDCGGADPCAHVFAAALAVAESVRSGKALRSASAVRASVRYRLSGERGPLRVARELVSPDGTVAPLRTPLPDLTTPVAVGDPDFALDRIPAVRDGAPVPADRLAAVLASLADCADVRAGDDPVRVSLDPVLPRATLDAHPKGYALRLARDPAVTGDVARGVARCGDVVRPVGVASVLGVAWEALPETRVVASADAIELVVETLPALREKIAVDVRVELPPVARTLKPRVEMGATLLPHLLTVMPSVVYGAPPCARVVGERLVHLGGPVPVRSRAEEVAVVHRMRDELGLLPGVRADFRGDDVPRFVARLRQWEGDGRGATASLFEERALVPRFEARDDGFDLAFELPREPGAPDGAARKADAGAVLTAWREGLDLVPLTDGTWAPLPTSWLRAHGHRVADLLAARREDGAVPRASLPALGALCDALEHPRPAKLDGLRALAEGFTAVPPAQLPDDLRAELRSYQRRGVDWLCFLRDAELGAVLADDMGLGKTLQCICALRGRALVVAPRSVVDNWAAELRRFRPGLRVSLYHGADRSLDPRADVTLTTYAVLRLDAEALAAVPWDVAVLDEAQAIKNPDSQTARAAYALRASWRAALSGTPVENRLDELWSLFHFTNPGLLGGRGDFDDRYAKPVADGDATAAARLRERTGPFVLRRLKRDVAPELPPRTEVVMRCELDARERAVYDTVRAAAQRDVVEALGQGRATLAVLEALLRLRQAACHAGLVPGQTADGSSKVTALVEALESAAADGHRALVFSQWTSLLDRVEPELRSRGIAFARLDGSTRDRALVVATFQAEAGPPVMLVSLKAGGTGLNLTAADHVFLLDPWWNPAVEDQAADRAHRIGQTRPVTVYRLVARDTVEERILALQEKKRSLAVTALDGGDPSGTLTRDDLAALFA